MSEFLRLERDGPVARLVIERADKKNAFDAAMWEGVPELVTAAMDAPEVRLLVVRSAVPGVFSAGADIGEFASAAQDIEWRKRNQAAMRAAQYALAGAAKPTIALVEGDCIGAGCGVALACDIRVASPAARLGITPVKLGLVYPLHDTRLLVDLVGPAQAKRMLFSGALLPADEAARIGLVDVVADDANAEVEALSAAIAAASPHTLGIMNEIVRRIVGGQRDDDKETLAHFLAAFDGEDFEEGLAAFAEKRTPRFRQR